MAKSASIQVGGNVEGSIVVGDHNFVVNTNYGTVVYKQAGPQVKLRQFAPQPPRPPRGFVNRTLEMGKLENWIASNEIVLIHAPDGLGKTALLRQAANTAAAKAMPNGVILLEAPGFEGQALGADDVFQQMFDALFESDPPLKVDAVTARTYLSNTRPLVVLDEVPLPPMLQRALPDLIPHGAFLLSADLPTGGDFQRLALGPLPREEAVQLLAEKAGIPADETLKFICGLLEDISLAVIIVGNLMRETGMTPAATLTALGAIQVGGMDPIAIAIDRAYMLVYSKLSETERQILATAALTPGTSLTPEWFNLALGFNVEPALDRLKMLGLLFTNSPRLRLPPGLRLTVRRRSTLDENATLSKLTVYLLNGANQGADFVRDELGNFLGAISWAVRAGRSVDVISLGKALDPYLTLHGLWEVWGGTLDHILNAAVRIGDRAAEAWALHQLGTRLIGLNNIPQATEVLRHALKLRVKLGDLVGAAHTQHNLDLLLPPAPPVKPSGGMSLLGKVLLALVVLGAAAGIAVWQILLRLPPREAVVVQKIAPVETALFYGDGAAACGPTATDFRVFLSSPESGNLPTARFRYLISGQASDWFDVPPLSLETAGVYRGTLNPAKNNASILNGGAGTVELEAVIAGTQPASVTLALNYLCATPTPVVTITPTVTPPSPTPDTTAPYLQNLRADPSPSYYGENLQDCRLPQVVTLSLQADDPSGIAFVKVRYRYSYVNSALQGEWQVAYMPLQKKDVYAVLIDNNANGQAIMTLDGQDGQIEWEVTAQDRYGNQATRVGPSALVNYKYCDVKPPEIQKPTVNPNPAFYGDIAFCPGNYPSQMQIMVSVTDESGVKEVYIQYHYRGEKDGPGYRLPLTLGDNGLYGITLDNNQDSLAAATLNNGNGYFVWQVFATDNYGNQAKSKQFVVPLEYHTCPPIG